MTRLTTPEAVAELRHELRTPLNLIIGYTEMLLEDATDPPERDHLEAVLRGGREILDQVNTALAISCESVSQADLDSLVERLRDPQARIVAATTVLLDRPLDAQLERDLRRIRNAAERLLTVELPRQNVMPTAGGAPIETTLTLRAPLVADHPARILVVDDQEDNRAVLERRLRRQGHTVHCTSGGQAALAQIQREQYDLVLLDVLMPDLDGYAVLGRLKGDPATRDVPVIMISALDDIGSVVRCIEGGAEDHLPKPFDPILLRARISACLEKKRLRDGELEYLREVGHVIEAATAVESGTFNPDTLAPVTRREDALGRLARVFTAMADQVRAREERLRKQVEALRREISEARPSPVDSPPSEAPELPTGHLLSGRYEILAELGRGGMGLVYRALDRELGEQVAVKTLRRDLVADETMLERFKSEIRLARHISDKHVVRTHDIGEWMGVHYLTMEYVEGISVRELIDTRERLGVEATLAIASQLAQSLAAAHDQGIIHRDIKPQNLLLDSTGVLKVMDFGVARLAERPSGLTEAGMVVGTPAYMAPEQMLAETVDHRSDLYAVGVVMYECLTGRIPFTAPSVVALIAKVLHERPIPPVELASDIPPVLSALVLRLLAKDSADRPASAHELLGLLRTLS